MATEPAAVTSPILDFLQELHAQFARLREGQVANYIPELAKADPDWFGICLVTSNGVVYEVGDSRQPFTIQSISKPFVYGLALEDNGRGPVLQKIGVEPTGDAFNSISLDPGTGRPRNPMINAGAIAAAGLINGPTPQTKLRRLLEMFGLYAGRDLSLDATVYESESNSGHRNRAIGHMLRNFGILVDDPTPSVELYFQQCSVSVTCRDLGVMAATLANRGINPITGKQAIRGEYVENILSVMGSCGMYDYAGEWIYNIGLPAKSGVSGGVIALLPGQIGIGVFSPPLDARGNSVRGIRTCDALSRHFDLNLFNRPGIGKPALRLKFTAAELNSSRVRTPPESAALHQFGSSIKVYQLQGNLTFATTEVVVHDIIENVPAIQYLVLDFKRVLSLNESAAWLIYEVLRKLSDSGRSVLFVHADRTPILRRYLEAKLNERCEQLLQTFDDNDLALEWCENRLLESVMPRLEPDRRAAPEEFELFHGLAPSEIAAVMGRLQLRTYQRDAVIINAGDEARELFLLTRGSASVVITLVSGVKKRLATFAAGMAFGEMAIIDHAPRSALILADSEVECHLLRLEDFEALGQTHPNIKIKLLENLCLGLCSKLRKANRELSVFD